MAARKDVLKPSSENHSPQDVGALNTPSPNSREELYPSRALLLRTPLTITACMTHGPQSFSNSGMNTFALDGLLFFRENSDLLPSLFISNSSKGVVRWALVFPSW